MATDSGGGAPAADIVNPMTGQHRLASGTLNTRQVLFCCVTGAAPIAAMLFNGPVGILGSGWAVPGAFILATVVLTIFSVGYIEMARTVVPTYFMLNACVRQEIKAAQEADRFQFKK